MSRERMLECIRVVDITVVDEWASLFRRLVRQAEVQHDGRTWRVEEVAGDREYPYFEIHVGYPEEDRMSDDRWNELLSAESLNLTAVGEFVVDLTWQPAVGQPMAKWLGAPLSAYRRGQEPVPLRSRSDLESFVASVQAEMAELIRQYDQGR